MNVDARISAYLQRRTGLDAGAVGMATIERALRQRMSATGRPDAESYWQQLQDSAAEQQALVDAVVVPETWFFRYPDSFRTLATLAVQRIGKLQRPLRLLSAPCSSGEEPYSMAMALLNAGLLAGQFVIDALDISESLIDRAGAGLYGKNSFRSESLEFRARYFSASDSGYLLCPEVRSQVRLHVANLLVPGAFHGEPPYDFVFCRNLLIYFNLATQEAVLHTLTRFTHKDGHLFVGPAEASLLSRMGLQAIGVPLSFAFRRADPEPVTAVLPAPTPPSAPRPVAPARPRASAPRVAVATSPKAEAASPLEAIAGLANAGQTEAALRLCQQQLTLQGPSAPLFYWLGLLNDSAGNAAAAQDYYRKALYLEPGHRESLAHLAALLEARGDMTGARRLLDRAARGAGKHG